MPTPKSTKLPVKRTVSNRAFRREMQALIVRLNAFFNGQAKAIEILFGASFPAELSEKLWAAHFSPTHKGSAELDVGVIVKAWLDEQEKLAVEADNAVV